jgi:hypothetical protein
VVQESYDLNVPVRVLAGAAGEMSLFSLEAENVILETVSRRKTAPKDVILRLYESKRMATRCRLIRRWLSRQPARRTCWRAQSDLALIKSHRPGFPAIRDQDGAVEDLAGPVTV